MVNWPPTSASHRPGEESRRALSDVRRNFLYGRGNPSGVRPPPPLRQVLRRDGERISSGVSRGALRVAFKMAFKMAFKFSFNRWLWHSTSAIK